MKTTNPVLSYKNKYPSMEVWLSADPFFSISTSTLCQLQFCTIGIILTVYRNRYGWVCAGCEWKEWVICTYVPGQVLRAWACMGNVTLYWNLRMFSSCDALPKILSAKSLHHHPVTSWRWLKTMTGHLEQSQIIIYVAFTCPGENQDWDKIQISYTKVE